MQHSLVTKIQTHAHRTTEGSADVCAMIMD